MLRLQVKVNDGHPSDLRGIICGAIVSREVLSIRISLGAVLLNPLLLLSKFVLRWHPTGA